MKLINFVKALLPRLGKDQMLEDLRVTISELDQVVSPNYSQAAEFFRSSKLKADSCRELSEQFYRRFDANGIVKQPTFIGDVAKRLSNVKDNALYVQGLIEDLFERDIIADGLTAKKAVLVRAAEQMSFLTRYAVDLLNFVYTQETIEVNGELEEDMKLAPAAIKHVQANISVFASLMSDYGMAQKDFEKILGKIPDVVVNGRSQASVASLYKESDIDPFSTVMISGFTYNPIYHVRLLIAEWQASRYKANKDKKKMLELRLLHLRLAQEKKNDPKVQNEILYIQNRVDKIERYLREVEESLEVEA